MQKSAAEERLLKKHRLLLWQHYVLRRRARARRAPCRFGHTGCISPQLLMLLQPSGGERLKDVMLFLRWVVRPSWLALNSRCISSLAPSLWSVWTPPFKASYLLLNEFAASGQTKKWAKGLSLTPGDSRALQRWGGRGGKTPYLCEDHLSLRPMTVATSPAQCNKGGRGQKPWQLKLSQQQHPGRWRGGLPIP